MNHRISLSVLGLLGLTLVLNAEAATTRPVHDPKMWEKDIAAFEAADQKQMPPAGGVEFFGSSTIRIWKVKTAFANQPVFNRGFGGSWSVDCDYYADRVVLPYKPRTIIFYAGDNDIGAGMPAAEVVKSFKSFEKKVHAALPNTNIVFISIKPSPSRWKYWPVVEQANAAIRKFCEKTPRVDFVDISKEMIGSDGKPRKELFQKDGLHMNAKGYAIWNRKLGAYVESTRDNQKF